MSEAASTSQGPSNLVRGGRLLAIIGCCSLASVDVVGTLAAAVFVACVVGCTAILLVLHEVPWRRLLFGLVMPVTYFALLPFSSNPEATFRATVQLLLTFLFPIMASRLINSRAYLSLVGLALFAALPFHILLGARWDGWLGLLASKNIFSFYMSQTLFFSVYFIFAWVGHRRFRAIGFIALPFAALALVKANSAGAIITITPIIMMFIGWMIIVRAPQSLRIPVIILVFFSALAVSTIVLIEFDSLYTSLLQAFNKDEGLTGRDYLWIRGRQYIWENPWYGYGYAAFWRQGNLEAEGLWRYGHILSRTGFNFHNLYINNLVEVGFVGFSATMLFLAGTAVLTLRWCLREQSPEAAMFFLLTVLTLCRGYVEVDFPREFGFTTFMLSAAFSYSLGSRVLSDRGYAVSAPAHSPRPSAALARPAGFGQPAVLRRRPADPDRRPTSA
ncbi:MAG: O-antigen ligase family protein [Alsobacter sp.]